MNYEIKTDFEYKTHFVLGKENIMRYSGKKSSKLFWLTNYKGQILYKCDAEILKAIRIESDQFRLKHRRVYDLNLGKQNIIQLPMEIGRLRHLTYLELYQNPQIALNRVPEWLINLPKLRLINGHSLDMNSEDNVFFQKVISQKKR